MALELTDEEVQEIIRSVPDATLMADRAAIVRALWPAMRDIAISQAGAVLALEGAPGRLIQRLAKLTEPVK